MYRGFLASEQLHEPENETGAIVYIKSQRRYYLGTLNNERSDMDDPGVPTQNMECSRGMVLIQQLLRICDMCY